MQGDVLGKIIEFRLFSKGIFIFVVMSVSFAFYLVLSRTREFYDMQNIDEMQKKLEAHADKYGLAVKETGVLEND